MQYLDSQFAFYNHMLDQVIFETNGLQFYVLLVVVRALQDVFSSILGGEIGLS